MPEQNHIHTPFQSFQEEANHVQKLSPSEIRRLGNRRRTTRRLGIAGGIAAATVVAVTAVALNLPTFVNSGPNIAGTPTPTTSTSPTPTVSRPPAVVPVTWNNVPGVPLMFPQQGTGVVDQQYEGLGQAALGPCDPGDPGLAVTNPNEPVTVLTRTFNWVGGTETVAGVGRTVRVLGLGSTDSATRVYNLYTTAAKTCDVRYQQHEEFAEPRVYAPGAELVFDGSGATQPARAEYVGLTLLRKNSDTGRFSDTMVIQSGTRVMVVTSTFDGQDYNCGILPNQDAGQCDFPAALADLLTLLDAGQ